jgi:hypothetical protein
MEQSWRVRRRGLGSTRSDGATPPDSLAAPRGVAVTRRGFLALAGAALSSSVLPVSLTACSQGGGRDNEPHPDFTVTLVRPTDLLSLTIGFVNLRLSGDSKTLNPIKGGDPAYLLVDFGPQHLLEQTFFEGTDDPAHNPPASPVQTLLAGNSRVVFVVPAGQSLEYSVASLLTAFGTLDMNVSALATPADGVVAPLAAKPTPIALVRQQRLQALRRSLGLPGGKLALANVPGPPIVLSAPPQLSSPTGWDTALELPTRLVLAPNQYGAWAHAASEVTSSVSQRTELWHTRLGVRASGVVDESDKHADARTVRAIWTRDLAFVLDPTASPPDASKYVETGACKPPSESGCIDTEWAPLRAIDRADIVFESANFGTTSKRRTPKAIQVNRLMLTSLGGWLDLHADFGDSTDSGLLEWSHRATMGRDHYVKIVREGILYPTLHRAVMIWITERKLTNATDPAEALWQRAYIVIREPIVIYDAGSDLVLRAALRKFPFQQVTITTLSTPALMVTGPKPTASTPHPDPPGAPVAPQLADTGAYYAFKMVGIDHAGREVHFESTAVWVPTAKGVVDTTKGASMSALQTAFDTAGRTASLNGQRVAFAPEIPTSMMNTSASKPGGATFETHSVKLTGWFPQGTWPPASGVPFLPQIEGAQIASEALRGFGNFGNAVDVAYHQAYVDYDFGGGMGTDNAGDLLLQLATAGAGGAPVDFSSHSDQSGGFLNPNLAITALSRAAGPVGGAVDMALGSPTLGQAATNLAKGTFDPKDFFSTILKSLSGAKVLGVFNLTDIIPKQLTDAFGKAPKFLTQALNDIDTLIEDAQNLHDILDKGVVSQVESAVGTALDTELQPLKDLRDAAKTLLDQVSSAIDFTADAAVASSDGTLAATTLASLPTALAGLPGALDALDAKLAALPPSVQVPANVRNLLTQLHTRADTLNQAVQSLGPTFTKVLAAYQAGQDLVKNLALKLDWTTPIIGFPSGNSSSTATPNDADIFDPYGGLLLSAELRLKATGGKPAGLDLLCGLEAFNVNLFGGSSTFLTVAFDKLQFVLKAGKKADVNVVLKKPGLVFKGPLSFVQTLTSIIPLDGFSDPPGISISTAGIEASFSIGLPTLSVGMFSLQNISIGAGFKIPFIGPPVSVNFDFCTRDNPFILTVSFLGGGGFFGIQLNLQGVESLEASFEFGAGIAVDFGVASGSVSAMAGIYFKMEFDSNSGTNDATLTGFFRLRGEVDVLGIITASIELYLELSYESSSGKVTGTATLDIDVSVFFFHATVSLTCQKRFGGGNGDPSFVDVMRPADTIDQALPAPFVYPGAYDPWATYLNAFAA